MLFVAGNWKVNGTLILNCPPNACDAVLWNQVAETDLRSTVYCEVGILNPDAGVN